MPGAGVPDRQAAAVSSVNYCGDTIEKAEHLPVLYRDADLIAIHKPAGLLVHRTCLDRRETTSALQLVRNQVGKHVYPVHRLDRPTSGVLLFTFSSEAAQAVAAEFAARQVAKTYLAVVRGFLDESGVIDHPLVNEGHAGYQAGPAKEAVTEYRRLAEVELPVPVGRYPASRYSLVELHPRTGRRHQLRRHLKHLMHPIIGDIHYGEGRHNRMFRERFDCHRLLLAAVELALTHPATGLPLTVTAPLAADFAAVVEQLGWKAKVPEHWIDQYMEDG